MYVYVSGFRWSFSIKFEVFFFLVLIPILVAFFHLLFSPPVWLFFFFYYNFLEAIFMLIAQVQLFVGIVVVIKIDHFHYWYIYFGARVPLLRSYRMEEMWWYLKHSLFVHGHCRSFSCSSFTLYYFRLFIHFQLVIVLFRYFIADICQFLCTDFSSLPYRPMEKHTYEVHLYRFLIEYLCFCACTKWWWLATMNGPFCTTRPHCQN